MTEAVVPKRGVESGRKREKEGKESGKREEKSEVKRKEKEAGKERKQTKTESKKQGWMVGSRAFCIEKVDSARIGERTIRSENADMSSE